MYKRHCLLQCMWHWLQNSYYCDHIRKNTGRSLLHIFISTLGPYHVLISGPIGSSFICDFTWFFFLVCEPPVGSTWKSLWFPTICVFGLSGWWLQGKWHRTLIDLELMFYIAGTARCADGTLKFTQKNKSHYHPSCSHLTLDEQPGWCKLSGCVLSLQWYNEQ